MWGGGAARFCVRHKKRGGARRSSVGAPGRARARLFVRARRRQGELLCAARLFSEVLQKGGAQGSGKGPSVVCVCRAKGVSEGGVAAAAM